VNEDADGYYAIVLPDEDVWQGFFLDPAFDFRGGRYVESLNTRLDSLGAAISSGEVYSHLSNRDQAMVGLLSALVADYFSKLDLLQMTLAACGIARVSGYSFFWIEGRRLPNGNHHAILGILKAQTALDAQLEIIELPAVYSMIHRGHFGSHL
jgi:hypothetical protein